MMSVAKKGGLGRGLNALFEDEETPAFTAQNAAPAQAAAPAAETPGVSRKTLPVASLQPGKYQPRNSFDEVTIKGLSDSIKQHGVIQPLLVRALSGKPGQYEIIGGERRWRAAQMAKIHEVPVIIRDDIDDEAVMEIALIDNLQREDLNAIDEAQAYHRLMEEFAHTQEKLAALVGKSRSHVANTLRLLTLPIRIHDLVRQERLSAGHARALITARDPEGLAQQVMLRGLSVRETERLASELGGGGEKGKAKKALSKDADTKALERSLTDTIGMKVTIDHQEKDGKIQGSVKIDFKTLDELDVVIRQLKKDML